GRAPSPVRLARPSARSDGSLPLDVWPFIKIGLDGRPRLGARDHGGDLECHACAPPFKDPGLEELQIVAAHKLEAAGKIGLDPARDIFEPLRQGPAALAQ